MELQIVKQNGINPKNMTAPETFSIRLEEGDTVKEEKRAAKNGGEFKQYTLFLLDSQGGERELRFLFPTHLNPLIAAYGGDTKLWEGKNVLVTPKTEGSFADVVLSPAE